MFIFEKDFFSLIIDFAIAVHLKHKIPFKEVLFQYTPLYVRLLGFSDEHPITELNPKWQNILQQLPKSKEQQAEFFYKSHYLYEMEKPKTVELWFGCFRYHYHKKENKYELHFRASDPLGNLGVNRMNQRKQELEQILQHIRNENNLAATFFARTWLLNTKAFTRLFPKEFKEKAELWPETLIQDNTYWGQFVNRNGKLRIDIAAQLLNNVDRIQTSDIRDYFPLKGLQTEIPIELVFKWYASE